MARKGWSKDEARRIQYRLNQIIHTRFDGVQARFLRACRLSRDTAAKWFGPSPRVPDTRTLMIVARQCDVSLDWLMAGRGAMDVYGSRTDAGRALRADLRQRLERLGEDDASRGLMEMWLGELPDDALWRDVIDLTFQHHPAFFDLERRMVADARQSAREILATYDDVEATGKKTKRQKQGGGKGKRDDPTRAQRSVSLR